MIDRLIIDGLKRIPADRNHALTFRAQAILLYWKQNVWNRGRV